MSAPNPFVFDAARLASRFSALQPASDPVQSTGSEAAAACLLTTLRLQGAGTDGRKYWLTLPLPVSRPNGTPRTNYSFQVMKAELPEPVIQILAGGADESRMILQATGPSECPPGIPNEVKIDSPSGESVARSVPFESWIIPLQAGLDFDGLRASPERLVALLHPCKMSDFPPAVLWVDAPGCLPVKLRATVAVFPDVRWSGELTVSAELDSDSQKGFRMKVESTVVCAYGSAEWRLNSWDDALAWCPWLGCLPLMAKSIVAIEALCRDHRAQGLDNPRLIKSGNISWASWPQCRVKIQSALREQPDREFLGYGLHLALSADPLLSGSGERSLLANWLENPLWHDRLAPLLAGLLAAHVSEVTQEIGLWLVVAGRISLRVQRDEERPEEHSEVRGESNGGITLEIEGRSDREYETIVVRAGSAERMTEPAGLDLAGKPSDDYFPGAPGEHTLLGRGAFSGLAIWALEKHRPGIRIRQLQTHPPAAESQPGNPLAILLSPRVWPSGAATEPAPIPWGPA
jgi:hypothetical protein